MEAFKFLDVPPPPLINLTEAVQLREESGRPEKYRKWSYISWTKLVWTVFMVIEKHFGKQPPCETDEVSTQSEAQREIEKTKQSTNSLPKSTTRYNISSKFDFQKEFDLDKPPSFYQTVDKRRIDECSECCKNFFQNPNYLGNHPLCETCRKENSGGFWGSHYDFCY